MAKKKNQAITLNQTEILGLAIQRLGEMWMKVKSDAGSVRDRDPQLAEDLLDSCQWGKKLRLAMQLYKIETGDEYPADFDLDEEV